MQNPVVFEDARAIVIGAGLGGLSAAMRLGAKGYSKSYGLIVGGILIKT